jgi:DNA-binding PadR family transcriptional regulator
MPAREEPPLSLTESLVLCLVSEGPTHGFAIAKLLAADGSLGRVWRVPRPVVYRALQRLEQLGLTKTVGCEPTAQGPVRTVLQATPRGRATAATWLAAPARHARDVRSELLLKLALLDRAGADPRPLLEAQRRQLAPITEALRERVAADSGFERTLALWRYETVSATLRFLDDAAVAESC